MLSLSALDDLVPPHFLVEDFHPDKVRFLLCLGRFLHECFVQLLDQRVFQMLLEKL